MEEEGAEEPWPTEEEVPETLRRRSNVGPGKRKRRWRDPPGQGQRPGEGREKDREEGHRAPGQKSCRVPNGPVPVPRLGPPHCSDLSLQPLRHPNPHWSPCCCLSGCPMSDWSRTCPDELGSLTFAVGLPCLEPLRENLSMNGEWYSVS